MGTLMALVGILTGVCLIVGLALSDWGIGQKQLAEAMQDEPIELPEFYDDLYCYLVECVEVEWRYRHGLEP